MIRSTEEAVEDAVLAEDDLPREDPHQEATQSGTMTSSAARNLYRPKYRDDDVGDGKAISVASVAAASDQERPQQQRQHPVGLDHLAVVVEREGLLDPVDPVGPEL